MNASRLIALAVLLALAGCTSPPATGTTGTPGGATDVATPAPTTAVTEAVTSAAAATTAPTTAVTEAATSDAAATTAPTTAPTEAVTSAAAATTAPTTAPTEAATAATPAGSTGDAVAFSELGVSLSYAPDLADSVLAESVPASAPADGQLPFWAIFPEHRRFTLNGYPVEGSPITPNIAVFPTAAYGAAVPEAQQALDQLQAILADPSAAEAIPVLPLQNAAQILRAQVRSLPFQSGTGVRFLTYYAQNAAPLANPGLLYVYQGLSADGQHLVSVTLPVTTPALDQLAAEFPSGGDPAAYQQYLATAAEQLELLGTAEFTPDLAELDALVQSISVE